jgi:hypothetical protein
MAITFTSLSSATVNENTTGTVYTVTVNGASGSTYSISGGADAALFNINASTGAVTFKNLPNYEAPTDADKNNRYEIIVKAYDGTTYAERAVTIIVKNAVSLYSDWTQLGADIDGEAADDYSGHSVSLSADGNIVAISAYRNDSDGKTDRGHVRVYKYNNNNGWQQLGADIDGEAAYDYSGRSVSLSADGYTVAIGAHSNDGNQTSTSDDRGHVRVYKYNNNGWQKLGDDIDGEAADDNSGISVSLSDDGYTVAIGANNNEDNGNNSGHVRVYKYNNNNGWQKLGDDINGKAAKDKSGQSVSLSADGYTVAIGAPSNEGNPNKATSAGYVHVYQYDNNNGWQQLGDDIDGKAAGDKFGRSVSLSADGYTVAIGNDLNDGNPDIATSAGYVRVYKYNNNNGWQPLGADIDGEALDDFSGYSVSLSADGYTVAIGAYGNDDNGNNSGHVRVYQYDNGWQPLGLDINGEAADDYSGHSVSLSADGYTVAIGANEVSYGGPLGSGYVRVYTLVKPPQITSGITASVSENISTSDIAYTVAATHVNDTSPLTYSISGGADAALFNINASTGAVTFKNLPNYEAPADADKDNRYEIIVKAADGSLSSIKAVTMLVTNLVTNNFSFRYSSLTFSTTEFHSFKPTLFGYTIPTGWRTSPKVLPAGIKINKRTGVISGTATSQFPELLIKIYATTDTYSAIYNIYMNCK